MTNPKTLVDELEALAAKATPGPWEFDDFQLISKDESLNYGSRIVIEVEPGTVYSEYSADSATLECTQENWDFITGLVNNLPAILSALRDLTEALHDRDRYMRERDYANERIAVLEDALRKAAADPTRCAEVTHGECYRAVTASTSAHR